MGSRLTVDASEYVTLSGHMAAPDPPMWWGQALLLAQSSRPRLGRVMAWSHIQLFYHATKNSRVGTVFLYSSKGYLSFRVPTVAPRPTSHTPWVSEPGCRKREPPLVTVLRLLGAVAEDRR